MGKEKHKVKFQGKEVTFTNLDKVLYPQSGIIKAEIIQYYIFIAPYMIQFAKNRLLSVIRYPDGLHAHKFYSKNAPDWSPKWLNTRKYYDDDIDYILFDSTPVAIWLANLASLEIHGMNSRMENGILYDHFVLDFDPTEEYEYPKLKELVIEVGEFMVESGFNPFVKTSGSRGAHIYTPIIPIRNQASFIDLVKLWAKAINKKFSKRTTLEFRKEKRKGKILIDINRNYKAQTTVLPYSTRAIENAPISMPLTWEAFTKTHSSKDYTISNVISYVEMNGHAWSDFQDKAVEFLGPDPIHKSSIAKTEANTIENEQHDINPPDWFSNPREEHMLATIGEELVENDEYVYENKWDGIRVFVYIWNGNTKIVSKSGRDISHIFPEIPKYSKNVSVVLDGELVVLNNEGKPDFSKIISRFHSKRNITKLQLEKPVSFYVFDILICDSKSCKDLRWDERRKKLKKVLVNFPTYKLSEAIKEGQLLYDAANSMSLEGIMIKKISAKYESGKRSDAWQKLKFRTYADCVILGYTEGEGERSEYFGSLHIGAWEDGSLLYRGRVGSGFDIDLLKTLSDLFVSLPVGAKWMKHKTEMRKNSTWFTEYLPFCEIQYASMTENGTFREPVFKKLKLDFYEL